MIELPPYRGRGFFITATGTDIGKTTAAAALAAALVRRRLRVGVCKPVTSGCARAGAGDAELVPADALLVGRAANLKVDDSVILRRLSPVRFEPAVSPHLAARMEGRRIDWKCVADALAYWRDHCDVLLVEGAGGWLTPLDERDHTNADLACALALPALLVTTPELGTLNATMLTVESMRRRGIAIAGLIINRVPLEQMRDINVRANLAELPRLSGVRVAAMLPEVGESARTVPLPETLVQACLMLAKECEPERETPAR